MADPLATLMAALSREDEIGNRVHALDDVRHAIPLIVLSAGLDVAQLSAGVQELLRETLVQAGLDPDEAEPPAPDAIVATLADWYRAHPVTPAILEEIRVAFEALSEGGPSKAAHALLGTSTSTGVLGGGIRPEGTIPAALGRLRTTLPPKKPG